MAEEEKKAKILIVDDSKPALSLVLDLLAKTGNYELTGATSAEQGIKLAHEFKPDLIISDYYMPGRDGFEFCQYIKTNKELASTMFLLLTAEKNSLVKVSTLSNGVDDYVERDVPGEVLLSRVKALLRHRRITLELEEGRRKLAEANRLLERNFRELSVILFKILDTRIPGAGDRAERAREIAEYVAEGLRLETEDERIVGFAAFCHEIGKVGLSDDLVREVRQMQGPMSATAYSQYPVIGSMIISSLTGFEGAAEYVYHQLENFDGSGGPDGLMQDEIPLGARILRAVVFQEECVAKGMSAAEVAEEARLAMNRILDPTVAALLAEFLLQKGNAIHVDILKLTVQELEPGMVLADDVYSQSGVKLLPKGVHLQDHMIDVLMHRSRKDPIMGGVYVHRR